MSPARKAGKTHLEIAQFFVKMSFCMLGDKEPDGRRMHLNGCSWVFQCHRNIGKCWQSHFRRERGLFLSLQQGLSVGMFCFAYLTPEGEGDGQEGK